MTLALALLGFLAGVLAVMLLGAFLLAFEQRRKIDRLDAQNIALRIVIQAHGDADLQRAAREAIESADAGARKGTGDLAGYAST